MKLLMGRELLAGEFIKEHGRKVADVMTREVISAAPDTPVADIATLLERHELHRGRELARRNAAWTVERHQLEGPENLANPP